MLKIISFIKTNRIKLTKIQNQLLQVQEIRKIMMISGEADILLEIEALKSDDLMNVIEQIEKIDGIININSHFVMDEWSK